MQLSRTVRQRFRDELQQPGGYMLWPIKAIPHCITQVQGQTDWRLMLGLHRQRKDKNGDSWIISLQKRSPLNEVIAFLRHLYDTAQNHQEIAAILAANGFPAAILAAGAAEVEAMVAADQA